jgi:DNA-directed RNA polymerase specialized sigma24 family protein
MLARAESGMMDLSGKSAVDVVAFLSAAARYGLLDLKRLHARSVVMSGDTEWEQSHGEAAFWPASQTALSPSSAVEVRDFAHALRSCLGTMPARSTRIWFLRAVLGLSSREIAGHPDVGLTSPHVDVLMQRTRADLKACMEAKGHARNDLPPGTFVELWDYFRGWDNQMRLTAREGTVAAKDLVCDKHPSRPARDDGSKHGS